jgi:hypothetical protein
MFGDDGFERGLPFRRIVFGHNGFNCWETTVVFRDNTDSNGDTGLNGSCSETTDNRLNCWEMTVVFGDDGRRIQLLGDDGRVRRRQMTDSSVGRQRSCWETRDPNGDSGFKVLCLETTDSIVGTRRSCS